MLGSNVSKQISTLDALLELVKNGDRYRKDTLQREKANADAAAQNDERKKLLTKITEQLAHVNQRHADADKRDAEHAEAVRSLDNRAGIVAMREKQIDEAQTEIAKLKEEARKIKADAVAESITTQKRAADVEAREIAVLKRERAAEQREAHHRTFIASLK